MWRFVLKVLFLVVLMTQTCCSTTPGESILSMDKIAYIKWLGEDVKESVSADVNPCDDFHKYVCDKSNSSTTDNSDHEVVFNILEDYLSQTENLNITDEKLKSFLTSCKDSAKEDLKALVRDYNFADSIGGWPALDADWKDDKFNLENAVAQLNSYHIPSVIELTYILQMGTNAGYYTLGLADLIVTQDEDKQALLKERLAQVGVENIEGVMNDAATVEKTCLQIINDQPELDDDELKTTLYDLKTKIPEIDWDKQAQVLTGEEVHNNFSVVVKSLKTVRAVFRGVSEMEPKIVANYLFCNFVLNLPTVPKDAVERTCLNYAFQYFHPVISYILVKKYFKDDTQRTITDMIITSLHNIGYESLSSSSAPGAEEAEVNYMISSLYVEGDYRDVDLTPNGFIRNIFEMRYYRNMQYVGRCFGDPFCMLEMFIYVFVKTFANNLYKIENAPTPLLYETLSINMLSIIFEKSSEGLSTTQSQLECLARQLHTTEVDTSLLEQTMAFHVYIRNYMAWCRKNEDIINAENDALSEFHLTSPKLLFIRLMQHSCGDDEEAVNQMTTFYRNTPEFSEEFSCPADSPMNPSEKCVVESTNEAIS